MFSLHPVRLCTISFCLISADVHFDPLLKVLPIRLHCKVAIFPFVSIF